MTGLIGYQILTDGVPPPLTAPLYEYLLAGNGIFVRGQRTGLEACIPVAHAAVRGLPPTSGAATLTVPRVPVGALTRMLDLARGAKRHGAPIEILFHLEWQAACARWRLHLPPQAGSAGRVAPTDTGPDSSYAHALIEVHSHHAMEAFWSGTDDADERSGFRLYGVLGMIFTRPVLRLRVGMHGYFLEIPAGQVFDLPAAISEGGRYAG